MTSPPLSFVVPKPLENARADKIATTAMPDLSRKQAKHFIEEYGFYHNGRFSRDPGLRLKEKDKIDFPKIFEKPKTTPLLPASDIALNLLYEDEDLIFLNKQAGLVVHPAPGHQGDTLVNALIHHCPDIFSAEQNSDLEKLHENEAHPDNYATEDRPGIVHRLDKETSGVMVVAKSAFAFKNLSEIFAKRDLSRRYLALVWGSPPDEGVFEENIGRSRTDRKKMAALSNGGKPAKTFFKVLERFGPAGENAALVECTLATGRTHQIRVHFAHNAHPLIGDPVYLRRIPRASKGLPLKMRQALLDFPRQALHALSLGFLHPRKQTWIEFSADPPEDFKEILDLLRHAAKE